MNALRIVVSAPAESPFSEIDERHPGIRIEGTVLGRSTLLRLSGIDATPTATEVVGGRLVVRDEGNENRTALVIDTPKQVTRMLGRIEEAGMILLPPLVWQDGKVRLRLLALGEVDPVMVRSVVQGAILESKSSLGPREIDAELSSSGLLLPSLTKKQAKAVLAALESGYYESPRRVTTEDIATSLGVARSTFEEHLKAAESKIINVLAPVVRLRLMEKELGTEMAGAEALRIFAQFSDDLGLYVSLAMRDGRVVRVGLSEERPAESEKGANPYLARILKHIESGEDDLTDIPLDLPITPFEREVLDNLRTVPPGEVVTYGELARRIGRPKASRAVGHACAANPAVIVVPCHRVVPASGGLGNYSAPGGSETKRKLLDREGALRKLRGI